MALLLLAGLSVACSRSWPTEPFTAEAWRASPPYERYVFYNSLVESEVLDGATREQVLALLGPPDSESPDQNAPYVSYILQERDPTFFDWDAIIVLDVRFDGQGRVTSYVTRGD